MARLLTGSSPVIRRFLEKLLIQQKRVENHVKSGISTLFYCLIIQNTYLI